MFWKVSFVFCLRPAPTPIAATYIDPIPKGVQGAHKAYAINSLYLWIPQLNLGKASVKNMCFVNFVVNTDIKHWLWFFYKTSKIAGPVNGI